MKAPETQYDCGGPLDGWGLSPDEVAAYLALLLVTLKRATGWPENGGPK